MLKSAVVYSMKGFGIKTPALFISTSIRPNRDTAVSTILAAVRGSPMSPSTGATFAAAWNGFALVMFREFATTLYPRFRNASTRPAPIPREAPVTIAVFVVFAISKLLLASSWRGPYNLALSLLRVYSQGPQLFGPAEEPQIIRLPVPSTPSRFRQSSGYSGPLHLQRYRRCRTFPARA